VVGAGALVKEQDSTHDGSVVGPGEQLARVKVCADGQESGWWPAAPAGAGAAPGSPLAGAAPSSRSIRCGRPQAATAPSRGQNRGGRLRPDPHMNGWISRRMGVCHRRDARTSQLNVRAPPRAARQLPRPRRGLTLASLHRCRHTIGHLRPDTGQPTGQVPWTRPPSAGPDNTDYHANMPSSWLSTGRECYPQAAPWRRRRAGSSW
jgi:hypothetical protein